LSSNHIHHTNLPARNSCSRSSAEPAAALLLLRPLPAPAGGGGCERGGRWTEDLASQLPWLPASPPPPLSSSTCTSTCCSSSRRPLRSLVSHPALPSRPPFSSPKIPFFCSSVYAGAALLLPRFTHSYILIVSVIVGERVAKLQAQECAYPH
jgi:hypothetical protein